MVDFCHVGLEKKEVAMICEASLPVSLKLSIRVLNDAEVLRIHIDNPQCEHISVACCHAAGIFSSPQTICSTILCSERITLLSTGNVRPDRSALGFQVTSLFEPLFSSSSLNRIGQSTPNGKARHVSRSKTVDFRTN